MCIYGAVYYLILCLYRRLLHAFPVASSHSVSVYTYMCIYVYICVYHIYISWLMEKIEHLKWTVSHSMMVWDLLSGEIKWFNINMQILMVWFGPLSCCSYCFAECLLHWLDPVHTFWGCPLQPFSSSKLLFLLFCFKTKQLTIKKVGSSNTWMACQHMLAASAVAFKTATIELILILQAQVSFFVD